MQYDVTEKLNDLQLQGRKYYPKDNYSRHRLDSADVALTAPQSVNYAYTES